MNKKNPTLVIMAAGMGSRYGGLKQIDPIDEEGHIIIDFSLYDAKKAGFEKVIFIIREENQADFEEAIGSRIRKNMEVEYAFQKLDDLPEGFFVPEGRTKPFGTGHAILSCKDLLDGPFLVINADDYYGQTAYQMMYDYLITHEDDEKYRYAMAGYVLYNTLTENGHVARGICDINEDGTLKGITERTHIEMRGTKAAYTKDDGKSFIEISPKSIVSMNMWGFTESILSELEARFSVFLEKNLKENPLKCEYFLPSVVNELVNEKKAVVEVLPSKDKWYGVTYREDKEHVMSAIRTLKEQGIYPKKLWGDSSER